MSEEEAVLFRSLVLEGYTLRRIRGCMKEKGYTLGEEDAPYIRMMIDILTTEEGE